MILQDLQEVFKEFGITTRSSTQCSVTVQRGGVVGDRWGIGGRFKREGAYVYVWLGHVIVCRSQQYMLLYAETNIIL